MSKGEGRTKKEAYFTKLYELLDDYKTIFVVTVDNVGSNQMHQIRQKMRGNSVVLMGKNTMVRRALRNSMAENPHYEALLETVVGNVGFIFTKGDLKETRTAILSNRVKAPAKAGTFILLFCSLVLSHSPTLSLYRCHCSQQCRHPCW